MDHLNARGPALDEQRWRSVDGDVAYSGRELARRLLEIGARLYAKATADELLSVPVGGAVNTGVSSYQREA